jgi:predicted XRE-type DNA-binding protein
MTCQEGPKKLLYSVAETAFVLGVSQSRVRVLIKHKLLDARKEGDRTMITRVSVHKYADGLPRRE